MNKTETLFENEHYVVKVQDVTDANNKVSRGYAVLNKATGVHEFESFVLPECLMFSRDMANHIAEFHAEAAVNDLQH